MLTCLLILCPWMPSLPAPLVMFRKSLGGSTAVQDTDVSGWSRLLFKFRLLCKVDIFLLMRWDWFICHFCWAGHSCCGTRVHLSWALRCLYAGYCRMQKSFKHAVWALCHLWKRSSKAWSLWRQRNDAQALLSLQHAVKCVGFCPSPTWGCSGQHSPPTATLLF